MKAVQRNISDEVIDKLLGQRQLINNSLKLAIGEFTIQVRSNSCVLLDRLADYFSYFRTEAEQADVELIAIESEAPKLPLHFSDWRREPGKTARKDSFVDMAFCRLVRKVRTGMVFLQSADLRVASGPCLANLNQIINFINTQYMNWLQQRDSLICHAAALTYNNRAYAFAGFSGGGKSTLMLHLLNQANTAYLTNDRLFIRDEGDYINAVGIPKLPRVNPGTIVHNPRLHTLISEQRRQALLAMPTGDLWQLEDKFDVYIDPIYGADRIVNSAPLGDLIILNWQRDSEQALSIKQIKLNERQDLLGAIMKSPGPFYQYPDGRFYSAMTCLPKQAYLDTLVDIDVYEVTGRVDFEKLSLYCRQDIFG